MRVIIIDDEYLARKRLETLLKEHDDVTIVGEARNGEDAIDLVRTKKPDVIFLDIQMPQMSGFEMLNQLTLMPLVVFTTAFDQYALKAFEKEALDYLLKPFDEERLSEALERVRKQLSLQQSAKFQTKMTQFLKSIEAENSKYLESIRIREKGREFEILMEDVDYLEADGNYIRLHQKEQVQLYRMSMNEIDERLNPKMFVRIHRSFIINKLYLDSCKYQGNNEYTIQLRNGKKITSGRSYKDRIASSLWDD